MGFALIFLTALAFKVRAERFRPGLFWLVMLLATTAGTPLSNHLGNTLSLEFMRVATLLTFLLAGVLILWRFSTGTLSLDRVTDRWSESFFWLAVLLSGNLGTQVGDFMTDGSGLGFAESNLLVAILCGSLAFGYYCTDLSRVGLFWVAMILTPSFGTTMGDLLTKAEAEGGIEIGTIGASAILFALFVLLIWLSQYWANSGSQAPSDPPLAPLHSVPKRDAPDTRPHR